MRDQVIYFHNPPIVVSTWQGRNYKSVADYLDEQVDSSTGVPTP